LGYPRSKLNYIQDRVVDKKVMYNIGYSMLSIERGPKSYILNRKTKGQGVSLSSIPPKIPKWKITLALDKRWIYVFAD
jgi:hypothetical protein